MPFISRPELESLSDKLVSKTEEATYVSGRLDTEVAKHFSTHAKLIAAEAAQARAEVKVGNLQQAVTNTRRETQKLENFLENLLTLEPSLKRFLVPAKSLSLFELAKIPSGPRKPVWDFEAVTRVIGLQSAKKAAAADEALVERLAAPTPATETPRFATGGYTGHRGTDYGHRLGFDPASPTLRDLESDSVIHLVRGGHRDRPFRPGDKVEITPVKVGISDDDIAEALSSALAKSKAAHPAGKKQARFTESAPKKSTKSPKKDAA